MSTTRGKPDIGLRCLPFFGSIKKSFVLLPSSPLQYVFLPYRYSSFGLRFPSGPLNLSRLSETPYLLRMRNTELRLLNPLTFRMSSMEYPLLYIATIVFLRSALLMFFSLVGWFIFYCISIIWAEVLRSMAHSSGKEPNISSTSEALVSGNKFPQLSIMSWIEKIRTTFYPAELNECCQFTRTMQGVAEFGK